MPEPAQPPGGDCESPSSFVGLPNAGIVRGGFSHSNDSRAPETQSVADVRLRLTALRANIYLFLVDRGIALERPHSVRPDLVHPGAERFLLPNRNPEGTAQQDNPHDAPVPPASHIVGLPEIPDQRKLTKDIRSGSDVRPRCAGLYGRARV